MTAVVLILVHFAAVVKTADVLVLDINYNVVVAAAVVAVVVAAVAVVVVVIAAVIVVIATEAAATASFAVFLAFVIC